MTDDDMVEKGSDTSLWTVQGGPDDGAVGKIVACELVDDAKRITVELADGRQVTFTEKATADQELPRELGS